MRRMVIFVAITLTAFCLLLVTLAIVLPDEAFTHFFSEAGFIEKASAILWVIAAAASLVLLRPFGRNVIALTIVFLLCAAREHELHTSFTNYSVLKISFYFDSSYPLWERLLFALVIGVGIYCLIQLTRSAIDGYRAQRGPLYAWQWLTLLGLGLLVFSKVLDRAPNLLSDETSWHLVAWSARLFRASEEGFEFLVPLILIAAIVAFVRQPNVVASSSASMPDARHG